ncbi:unnamed protein product [Pleuronectes platessa]|uniref:Uncharacterized protein n=1 Tax=Pleuronectes platessa TaxID=8262 RepID=A0A9N7YIR2_PLEPL|nr:unnamed protein product [Pleuronectes platessa]
MGQLEKALSPQVRCLVLCGRGRMLASEAEGPGAIGGQGGCGHRSEGGLEKLVAPRTPSHSTMSLSKPTQNRSRCTATEEARREVPLPVKEGVETSLYKQACNLTSTSDTETQDSSSLIDPGSKPDPLSPDPAPASS